jgi:altronate hydrolase
MYGVLVGKTNGPIAKGAAITTANIHHAASDFKLGERKLNWHKPEVDKFAMRTFLGITGQMDL